MFRDPTPYRSSTCQLRSHAHLGHYPSAPLRNGALTVLGEDRALGTGCEQLGANRLAAAWAARAEIAITDLGMVEGRGGVLMVAGATPES
jgi:hypothetical protein